MRLRVRSRHLVTAILIFIFTLTYFNLPGNQEVPRPNIEFEATPWTERTIQNSVKKPQRLPYGRERKLPVIQTVFAPRTEGQVKVDTIRLDAIKAAFNHTWQGYRKHAWLEDELSPISGGNRTTFGNWSATLVDSLDTLWIMGFKDEFNEAVGAVAKIDFSRSTSGMVSVFETTIRYLGGLLSAYDLSGEEVLLKKAVELGEFLYGAFDTPTRLPVTQFSWESVLNGSAQHDSSRSPLADIASLSLEFTRLTQLTGENKYFDAVQRISNLLFYQQQKSVIPGLWPIFVNPEKEDFATGNEFSLGNSADSAYEYIPKMNLLLGGQNPEYGMMYSRFMEPVKKHILYRPMTKDNRDVLLAGYVGNMAGSITLVPSAQHLGCFVGGMVAIGAKTVGPLTDLDIAAKLADGCVWAYESTLSGIMPETMAAVPCISKTDCPWNEAVWHQSVINQQGVIQGKFAQTIIFEQALPPGFTQVIDDRYLLRPEALESVFVLYRTTGDIKWQDKAWKMWRAIEKSAKTDIAFAQLNGLTQIKPQQVDTMESFFPAETLKYLYLTFSDPSLISLDDWVFNTEAHPFRRPIGKGWM